MDRDIILKRYPFLKITNSIEDYVEPTYYNKLLKPYIFSGVTDLELFRSYVEAMEVRPQNILELCSGSGRVSKVARDVFPDASFTLVDLSERMLGHMQKEFMDTNVRFAKHDAINFLNSATEVYDFIYTLWGFSHSVHQHVHRVGADSAMRLVEKSLTKFIEKNIISGGKMYLVHFDSMSEEQSILMRQWRRVYKAFSNLDAQSPSKLMIDAVLSKLDNSNQIYLVQKHLLGDPIVYKDINELIEIFLNFHIETYFNNDCLLQVVIQDVQEQVEQYRQPDGSYLIRPGCYIYEITKK